MTYILMSNMAPGDPADIAEKSPSSHNLRVRRVRRGYRRLGKDVIEKVLALVREVVSSSLAETFR
jgi:hypothetical protein